MGTGSYPLNGESQNVDGLPRYDFEVDPESDSTHAKVIRLVGRDKRVLELGCATGYMTRVLRDRGCQVVAVEIDAKMAERARPFCERLLIGDIEQVDLSRELGEDRFDVVVAADFLEHLRDPLAALRAVREYLDPAGYLVASLPNVAHGSVRLALLEGRFPYNNLGLLDHTHLRFFTRETMETLFEDAGFAVGYLDRQQLMVDRSEVTFDTSGIPDGVLEALSKDPESTTYQFIVIAYPLPHSQLKLIQERIRELAKANEAVRREIAILQKSQGDIPMRDLVAQHEEAQRELSELRARLENQADLEQQVRELAEERDAAPRELAEWRDAAQRELGAVRQTLHDQTAHIDVLEGRVAVLSKQKSELRAKLLDAHDQLLRRDDEILVLRERDARIQQELAIKDQYIQEKERHVAALQTALDRILYSTPGKIFRSIRAAVTLGRR